MKNTYYPRTGLICHHFSNNKGCIFCGYHSQSRIVSKKSISSNEMIDDFNSFAMENLDFLKKEGVLTIAPNGSWFTQVPQNLRDHIYNFLEQYQIPLLKYESRASLFNPLKAQKEVQRDLTEELKEIQKNHIVSFGLEVADNNDLKRLNKGCCLEDYIDASRYVHKKGAQVCANILLSPPKIRDSYYKAFMTAKFGAEQMNAQEFLIMACIPMKDTVAYEEWIKGIWNPISATAASEIVKIIKEKYAGIKIHFNPMRTFSFHGRHGKFKRNPGIWGEEEKQKIRKEVRQVAQRIF
jgi:radical SAM enzyme (TIGR01210 family)